MPVLTCVIRPSSVLWSWWTPVEGQTPASVIAERGPDQAVLDVESARLLETFGKIQVFEVPRK